LYNAYKHNITQINKLPDLTNTIVCGVPSNICKSKYYPEYNKTASVEEMLKRPNRYFFYFFAQSSFDKKLKLKYCCYYDSLEKAKEASDNIHKQYLTSLNS
jgi:hypothetical protein